jgi:hypothetical protein
VDAIFLAVCKEVVLGKARVGFDLINCLRMNVVSTENRRGRGERRNTGTTPVASIMPWI